MKITQFLLATIVVFLASGCENNNIKNPTVVTEGDTETLRYLKEVEWPKAYAEQDTLLLDRILGDDFKMIDNSGKWYSKEDELSWIKQNATSYDSFYYEIKRLEVLDNGTAVVCGTGHIIKDSLESIYQSSNVLVKREGVWEAILSHVSGHKKLDDK